MLNANNKDTDQPVDPRSLISVFVVRCLDRTIAVLAISKVSRLLLVSEAEQASLSLISGRKPRCHVFSCCGSIFK